MKALQHLSGAALSHLAKLTHKKYRREAGRFLIEGPHLVAEALAASAGVEMVLVTPEAAERAEIAALLAKAGSRHILLHTLSEKEIGRLSEAVTSQGIVAVVAAERGDIGAFWKSLRAPALAIALEHVSDPGNAGTIIRTAAWFGAAGVLLSDRSVELHNPKVLRSTMGAVFHLPVFDELDLVPSLVAARKAGFRIVVTALDGEPFDRRALPERAVIAFGSEADGASAALRAMADAVVTIPRFGSGESLNVAGSCAAILGSVRLP